MTRDAGRDAQDSLVRLADVGMHTASLLHELRQPLFAVLAAAELGLADDADPRAALSTVLTHLSHVRDLVDRYGGLGRTDEPERTLDLREPVLAAVELLTHRARRAEATLVTDCTLPVCVVGREAELRQVAVNLIQNALDAVDGGSRREVSIRLSAEGADAVLTVRDSGPGIPGSLLAHVFEPFVSGKPAAQGSGLGLYITRTIVESTRGGVAITSDDHGTCVRAHWPLAITTGT